MPFAARQLVEEGVYRLNMAAKYARDSMKVVVVGGGAAGCAAAAQAAKLGADVLLLERTDMLLGCALRAGQMNINGRFTVSEEAKAMGGEDMLETFESVTIHQGHFDALKECGHNLSYLYDLGRAETACRKTLGKLGVEIEFESRVTGVVKKDERNLGAVTLSDKRRLEADVFVDATGTFGTISQCSRYGPGCVMCIMRCPTFGNRVSIATEAGAQELTQRRTIDGEEYVGGTTASVIMYKETLDPSLRTELDEKGAVVIPLPRELVDYKKLKYKASTAFAGKELAESVLLFDCGFVAKARHLTYLPLRDLRKIPGFQDVMIEHTQNPVSHKRAGFIRFVSICLRDDAMRVEDFDNLLCAGEKSGPFHGVVDCIVSGDLAGYNAVKIAAGRDPLILPRTTILGDFTSWIREQSQTKEGLSESHSLGGGRYFSRMKELGLYSTDARAIHERVERQGFKGVLAKT